MQIFIILFSKKEWKLLKIAITGNIASGKSEAEKIIISLGFKVFDTDKINHDILENDINTRNELINIFKGFDILDEKNNISRTKIGNIVFDDVNLKKKLENLLHKKIFDKLDEIYEKNKNEKLIFISIPLLFEIEAQRKFDKIIFISADESIRLERLIKRNNYTEEYAKKRIQSQLPESEKIKMSDFVIVNNSDTAELKAKTIDIIKKLNI